MRIEQARVGLASATAISAVAVGGMFAAVGFAGGSGPATQYQYGDGKVTICHHTKGQRGGKHVTIRVSRNAVPAHMRHGDTVGACTSNANRARHATKAHKAKFHKPAKAKKAKRSKGKGRG